MAKHLARIHGTEEDKVNCPFYFKIGACRHADRCSRIHHRPAFSQTILIKHLFRHPVREAELKAMQNGTSMTNDSVVVDKDKAMEDFLVFFENMYMELGKFGSIEALHVCDNLGDHIVGHVYIKYSNEEEAADALNILNGRYYDGRKMEVEFSPVTDFREARCRDFDEDTCNRGGFCNFMHIKPVPMCLIRSLEEDCEEWRRREDHGRRGGSSSRYHGDSGSRDRDYERDRRSSRKRKHRDRDRERGDRGGDRDRDKDRSSRRDRDRRKHRERMSDDSDEEAASDSKSGDHHDYAPGDSKDDENHHRDRARDDSGSRSRSRTRSRSPKRTRSSKSHSHSRSRSRSRSVSDHEQGRVRSAVDGDQE